MATKRDHPKTPDKHFTADGRKLKDLEYVGESAPDADPDVTGVDPERSTNPRAGSPRAEAEEDPAASRR